MIADASLPKLLRIQSRVDQRKAPEEDRRRPVPHILRGLRGRAAARSLLLHEPEEKRQGRQHAARARRRGGVALDSALQARAVDAVLGESRFEIGPRLEGARTGFEVTEAGGDALGLPRLTGRVALPLLDDPFLDLRGARPPLRSHAPSRMLLAPRPRGARPPVSLIYGIGRSILSAFWLVTS